jgi:hypothetical protein
LSSYFLLPPKRVEPWLRPENAGVPDVLNKPGVYFLSPNVGVGVLENKEPELLPKVEAGFYLFSGFSLVSFVPPEKSPPPRTGFFSSSFGVPMEGTEGVVFLGKSDEVVLPSNDPVAFF